MNSLPPRRAFPKHKAMVKDRALGMHRAPSGAGDGLADGCGGFGGGGWGREGVRCREGGPLSQRGTGLPRPTDAARRSAECHDGTDARGPEYRHALSKGPPTRRWNGGGGVTLVGRQSERAGPCPPSQRSAQFRFLRSHPLRRAVPGYTNATRLHSGPARRSPFAPQPPPLTCGTHRAPHMRPCILPHTPVHIGDQHMCEHTSVWCVSCMTSAKYRPTNSPLVSYLLDGAQESAGTQRIPTRPLCTVSPTPQCPCTVAHA